MIELEKITQTNDRSQLIVSDDMKSDLMSVTSWVSFINALGAIGLVLLAIVGIGVMVIPSFNYGAVSIIYIIFAGIFFVPLKRSFAFVNQARLAVRNDNNEELGKMFGSMKFIVKFYGIFYIVILCLYALAICMTAIIQWTIR